MAVQAAQADDSAAVSTLDGDQAEGEPLSGHTGCVYAVASGRLTDGRLLLASGGWDQTVRLWDPSSGRPVAVIPTLDAAHALALITTSRVEGQSTTLLAIGTDAAVIVMELQGAGLSI